MLYFRDPHDIWNKSPSFMLHEYLIYIFIARILKNCDSWENLHIIISYIIGGFVIESLTQAYPDIDNFWHDQGTISYYSTSKPLYIMMMYIWSYAIPCLLSRIYRFNIFSESAFIWLVTISLYGIYDTFGVTHLWWLWHQTDQLFIDRFAGVPTMSTWWSGVHGISINLAIRICEKLFQNQENRWRKYFFNSIVSGIFGSTVIMFLMFSPYHVMAFFGATALQILGTTALICISILAYFPIRKVELNNFNRLVLIWVLTYVAFLLVAGFLTNTNIIQRTHTAQEFGPCETVEMIYGGNVERFQYACFERNGNDFFDMSKNTHINETVIGSTSYTVYGRKKTGEFWVALFYHATVLIACILAILGYAEVFKKIFMIS